MIGKHSSAELSRLGDTLIVAYPSKNIVMIGSHDVAQEVYEQFVAQSGLGDPEIAPWVWSNGKIFGEGEPGIYYPKDMEDRYLAEVEGVIYTLLVYGLEFNNKDIVPGLCEVCETQHCVCLGLDEQFTITDDDYDEDDCDPCKNCVYVDRDGCEDCVYGGVIEDKISE
jgi:hypothetical protein